MPPAYHPFKAEKVSLEKAGFVLVPCDVLDSPFRIVQQFICLPISLRVSFKEAQRHTCFHLIYLRKNRFVFRQETTRAYPRRGVNKVYLPNKNTALIPRLGCATVGNRKANYAEGYDFVEEKIFEMDTKASKKVRQ